MHILIIPSEGFVPAHDKLEGIFQYHQAVILKEGGYRVGALSVRLSYSVPMILKGLLRKVVGKRSANATDNFSTPELFRFGLAKIFRPKSFVTTETIDGVSVYRIEALYRRRPSNNKNHISWIKAGMLCFETYLAKEGRPDLIHAHEAIYAGMLAERIHAKYGIKYLITEHSSSFAMGQTDEEILHRVRKAYASAGGLYAVSHSFAGLLNRVFSFDRFRYLPNVIDQELERAAYAEHIPAKRTFQFLHIAVFKPVKDQRTLLLAFKKLLESGRDAVLRIGGDGELEIELRSLVKSLGLEKSVQFLGRLNRQEVIHELKTCDCFVLSSKYETFGLVVIEAMLFGKPVIATRCGVSEAVVTENIGFLTNAGDVDGLTAAMQQMMKACGQFNPKYIRTLALEGFGKKPFLQHLHKIYKEAV